MSESPLVSVFKTVDNIKSAIELGKSDMVIADSAKLIAQISAAIAVEGFIRTYSALEGFGLTLSAWRAGQGISGAGIVKQQALAGFVASEMVGLLIDKARQLNIGGWVYDLLHPSVDKADLQTYINDASWLGDEENGSAFYTDSRNFQYFHYENPDDEAYYRLGRIGIIARKWELNVRNVGDELWQKVASGVASPIIIDIGGDGVNTTNSWLHSVDFDVTGDGVQDRTAWSSGEDAFLAIDENKNGKIDGVNELFGGTNRGDGFAKLSECDSNGDGQVDELDNRYAELLLWQDRNSDGVTDVGELINASQAGLESVSTFFTSQDVFQNGNLFGEVSTAVWQGRAVEAVDVYFRYGTGKNSGGNSSGFSDQKHTSKNPHDTEFVDNGGNYVVDSALDVVTEAASAGTDTIESSVTWTLATNFENLALTGTVAVNATDNTAANTLRGNSQDNSLDGGAGSDTMVGGAGNDSLIGGVGADSYVFGRGYGADRVTENEATASVKDVVLFGAGIVQADVAFTRSGNALIASILGTSDALTMQDWYLGNQYHLEEFRFTNGEVVTDVQAQALVSAMAAFVPTETSAVFMPSNESMRGHHFGLVVAAY